MVNKQVPIKMKSLIEYICESIGSKELDTSMDVSDISIKDFERILFRNDDFFGSDSYIRIFGDKEARKDLRDQIGIVPGTTKFYKMTYNGTVLGVFSLFYLKDMSKMPKFSRQFLTEMFYAIYGSENGDLYESKPTNLKTYTDTLEPSPEEKRRILSLIEKSVYIPYLQISSSAKGSADVSQIAVIKSFYKILLDMLKKQGIETICAIGCDTDMAEKYVRSVGFRKVTEYIIGKYPSKFSDIKITNLIERASSFVYKHI